MSGVRPMSPIDRQLHIAAAALARAKETGNQADIKGWTARIDQLLDDRLSSTSKKTTAKRSVKTSV